MKPDIRRSSGQQPPCLELRPYKILFRNHQTDFFMHVQINNNRPHRHLCCLAPGQGLIQVEAPSTDSGGQCSPPPGMNENKCTW